VLKLERCLCDTWSFNGPPTETDKQSVSRRLISFKCHFMSSLFIKFCYRSTRRRFVGVLGGDMHLAWNIAWLEFHYLAGKVCLTSPQLRWNISRTASHIRVLVEISGVLVRGYGGTQCLAVAMRRRVFEWVLLFNPFIRYLTDFWLTFPKSSIKFSQATDL
jgi:hypothetical protein